ncbi:GNAT family N-acetyltransferase [Gordonia sp. HY002]|uniref:GNAT family N-acetyltransferase n=1 Tax=Gordonia zhenghanii TaxID=2911516 RepID=UPI001EF145F6|nr:GNAT family N-acetyltransferase [Gordonia zhenghanii]MCF8569574.1 GNAT family N-acetyltransferase [Gordonia zhenghanii]MCF8602905.1 GNAT family N-acetyltransferase [Gordonia zhenghanii]
MSDQPTLTFCAATQDVFDDVETILGPKRRPDAIACWCLTYRLGNREAARLDAPERRQAVFDSCGRRPAPGILAYDTAGDVVGWAAVARRGAIAALADHTTFPPIGDGDPWTVYCLRTRGGRRRRGIGQRLLQAAVDFAVDNGADVVDAYPVDPVGTVSPIFAYPGIRSMYEREGFTVAGPAGAVPGGPGRVAMRLSVT